MKRFVLAIALIMCAVPALGQSLPAKAGADASAEAKSAIEKGNAQWSEGWFKRDAGMVSAIFAEDGVQLTLSGKVVKGRQQIMGRMKTAMEGAEPGVKVTVTTVSVWVDGDTAYETGKYKYDYVEKESRASMKAATLRFGENRRTVAGNWQWICLYRLTSSPSTQTR